MGPRTIFNRRRAIAAVLTILLSASPCRSEPTDAAPPGGPAECSTWPRNPDKVCVGFAVLFTELAGEAKTRSCDSPPSADTVARQMWDCFTGKAPADACTFC